MVVATPSHFTARLDDLARLVCNPRSCDGATAGVSAATLTCAKVQLHVHRSQVFCKAGSMLGGLFDIACIGALTLSWAMSSKVPPLQRCFEGIWTLTSFKSLCRVGERHSSQAEFATFAVPFLPRYNCIKQCVLTSKCSLHDGLGDVAGC